ncbi:hypothetical protein ACVWW5_006749 [Bradyrhizobium sp. LM3.4]
MRLLHAGDDAGHGNRAGTMDVAVVLHPLPREQIGGRAFAAERIVGGAQALRRAHAVVDHLIAIFRGAVEHHRAAAAHAAVPGLQHIEREGGRDDRVHAISARGQHLCPHFGRPPGLRGDDAAFGCDGGLADGLGEAELVRHDDVCVSWLELSGLRCAELRNLAECSDNGTSPPTRTSKGRRDMAGVKQAGEAPRRECPGHRRAEATPSFGRLCPGMTN